MTAVDHRSSGVMSVLLSFFSKLMVIQGDSRQQQNRVLDSTPCAFVTMARVLDSSFLVLTGSEYRLFWVHYCLV